MINTLVGNLGHFLVIVSFVTALVSSAAYFQAVQTQNDLLKNKSWVRFARIFFLIHGLSIIAVVGTLFYMIYNHLYEYHYVWSHSSDHLPVYYMISCFWEGQEGSFLLWIFWHVVLGFVLMATNKFWEAPVMSIFALVQAFLASMILGVVIFQIKIGSDPFILLRDAMPDIPVFTKGSPIYNPNFVPEDGNGLNPLLQNYWMVIHPPTLFLGFATTLIPFAYCIAGLWLRKYKDWIRPALPWALFSGAVLGLGILMGGYWAYETLNFGGYWNWDPVENAVYVPWLVLVATIHTMIAFKKNSAALKSAIILTIATFVLILYATFLTRSGVLGNASVHSFTDLGLSGQLLIYLLSFTFLSAGLLIFRWKDIPDTNQEVSVYSREFWIFMGATVLCLAGFQVLLTTSIPVFNAIAESMGFLLNIALPVDQVAHYTKFQFWAAVLVAFLSGTGQFFWWKKIDRENLFNAMVYPLIFTLLISAAWIALGNLKNFQFMLLLSASIYTVVANSSILVGLFKKKSFKLSGGAIAHIGLGMMLLGILFSSGYSNVISKNTTGRLYSTEFTNEMNEDNVLLWYNQPTIMGDYQVTYKGSHLQAKGFPHYVKKSALIPTEDPYWVLALENIDYQGKTYFEKGDSIEIYPENTFYEVEYRSKNGRVFSLFPRAQVNPQMGLLASPDIRRQFSKDLYTHVSSIIDPAQEREWSEMEEHKITPKDTFFVNDYVVHFEGVTRMNSDKLIQLTSSDVGIEANLQVFGRDKIHPLHPKFLIRDQQQVARIPDASEDLGMRITLLNINPQSGEFTFGVETTQKDYIIMKAMEKPLINVLWIGTLVLMLGFGLAIYRRYTEFVKMRNKGLE